MHAIARLSVFVLAFAAVWVGVVPALPVGAQETPTVVQDAQAGTNAQADTAPQAQAPQAQVTPVDTADATSIPLDPVMVLTLVLVLLLLALFALSEIFRYLRDGREDYYRTFREFARKGVYLAPVMVNATATQARSADPSGPESMQAPEVFEMTGPGSLAAGEKATYTARLGVAPATGTVWELVDPDGAAVPAQNATLDAAPDRASATLTATRAGTYVVGASPGGNPSLRVRTAVTVVEPPAAAGEIPPLPFIGQGYGSIVGAILLLAVVVVLAATRAIDADIIGVLLGSIAGYLFGVGISRGTS